jgi:DNA-binding CsgD family transcriptional regulator
MSRPARAARANAIRELPEQLMDRAPLPRGLAPLSRREREVALHVFAGRDNREIAAALGISAKTVEGHLSSAFAKLGLRSRAQLAVYVARSCA